MLRSYTFERPYLTFNGNHLCIKDCNRILQFTNISDFNIEGSRVFFLGDYIPEKYEIISFKLKDSPDEHLGRFIEFTHDGTGIKVDFSFDRQTQFPHKEPICYSDVEIVTFTNISDNIQYDNVWKSMDYIHYEKLGIIKKDFCIPEPGDTFYFIDSDMTILSSIFNDQATFCQDHIRVYNCFKTEQEAKTIRDQFLQLLSER